jgi:hypothetical protein
MNLRHCIAGLALLALGAITPVHAQLTVEPSVTASAGMFHYNYTVSNNTASDISVITLAGLFSAPNAVQHLVAPTGFGALFDPGVSLLSFFEDAQSFTAGGSFGGFMFDSPYAPGAGTYEAISIFGDVTNGRATVPSSIPTISAVPEPSTYAAVGGLLLVALVAQRKLRPFAS